MTAKKKSGKVSSGIEVPGSLIPPVKKLPASCPRHKRYTGKYTQPKYHCPSCWRLFSYHHDVPVGTPQSPNAIRGRPGRIILTDKEIKSMLKRSEGWKKNPQKLVKYVRDNTYLCFQIMEQKIRQLADSPNRSSARDLRGYIHDFLKLGAEIEAQFATIDSKRDPGTHGEEVDRAPAGDDEDGGAD